MTGSAGHLDPDPQPSAYPVLGRKRIEYVNVSRVITVRKCIIFPESSKTPERI